ncbi:MAG: protein kinase [Acidobacteria bacterium]|nr:protein kinase [Acidobacteriota bacterium]
MEPFAGSDRFVVERTLGRGGYGVVYQVFDRARNARAALKTFHTLDAAAVYRLKQEFRTLADLSHPNLAALYELFSDGQQWFFTMELVDGTGFVSYVRGQPQVDRDSTPPSTEPVDDDQPTATTAAVAVPEAPVAPIAPDRVEPLRRCLRELATGLGYLHGQGLLHHDVKSSNVLVTRDGRVVLLDFGLVAEIGRRSGSEDGLHGTLAYISPEQIGREPVTAASDWYSVGVMLSEALLGRLPFSGSSAAVLDAKRRLDLPQPRDLADGIPADLNDLCRDLLNRDPARRPDATAVLARLDPRRAASVAVGAARPLPQFIGRARELAELDSAFDAACQGRAVIACVQGAPGIGKSALVRRFLDAVRERRAEAVVLAGRCYEREAVPYKALDSLVDALSLYLVGLSPSQVDAVLPRDVSALARVFPVLRRVDAVAYARQRAADIPDAQEVRRRAFQAFRELIGRIADRQPLLLFIDDVHWGDADSAALLTEMLRPADRPALLLLATYRSREALASPIVEALQATAATSAVDLRDLRLGELTAGESQQLARALLQTRELSPQSSRAEALARESAGNPFFLHELVQDVQAADAPVAASADHDAGDVTLERVIHRRIGRLPSTARRLVEALAVFGRPVDVMLAGRAADVEAQALDALVMLRGASLVRQAAGRAVEALAFDRAAALYRDALDLLPAQAPARHRLAVSLGDALARAGRGRDAAQVFLAAAPGAEPTEALELTRRAAETTDSSRFGQCCARWG